SWLKLIPRNRSARAAASWCVDPPTMITRALLFVLGGTAGALGAYAFGVSMGASGELARERSPAAATVDRFVAPVDDSTASATSASGTDRQVEQSVARDPIAALLEAAATREPGARRRAVMLVGALWARSDPEAALQQSYR